jgi:hypothetical protein
MKMKRWFVVAAALGAILALAGCNKDPAASPQPATGAQGSAAGAQGSAAGAQGSAAGAQAGQTGARTGEIGRAHV